MNIKNLPRAIILLILLALLIPANHSRALAAPPLPQVDMFQLPWEQGLAWVALDGFDNGSDRHLGSPHNYLNGGAIDFAPHNNMLKGENTSNFWVTAAAAGTVAAISKCHLIIAHSNGWVTEYQHLANFQVKLGDVVARNQRLAVIANASSQPVCLGSVETDIPHLHFTLRPNMVGATLAGWEFKYNSFFNLTTFSKDSITVGLFKPLLNAPGSSSTPTPLPSTATPASTATTPTPSGPFVSTEVNPAGINIGEIALATVSLNNVPAEGYTSAEFTCTYDASLVEVSNILVANLFGADPATAIQDPQNGSFIVAIAGSNGNKATTSGVVFTFNVKALQAGQTVIECKVRVNNGNNILTDLPSIGSSLTINGVAPTLTPIASPTPTGPTPVESPTSTLPPVESPTPTITVPPLESPTPTLTFTPVASPTSTPLPNGTLTGQVIASKPVTVGLYDAGNLLITSATANPDGTFSLTAPAGTYTVRATASGFLSAQGSAILTGGSTTTKPVITLLAGDIDNNNVIDQFDALTIGMSYNTAVPAAADLNNDGIINVLDLELLAQNYRDTGPSVWE